MKTEQTSVAGQYAKAVIELAGAEKRKVVLNNLKGVSATIDNSAELQQILRHPSIPAEKKKEIIVRLFGGKIDDLTQRLLELLCDRRRIGLLGLVEQEYEKLWREKENISLATLIFAEKPDTRFVTEVKARLAQMLKRRPEQIELTELEDKSLIGGYVLRLGDKVIDGSLKGRLESIEKSLLAV